MENGEIPNNESVERENVQIQERRPVYAEKLCDRHHHWTGRELECDLEEEFSQRSYLELSIAVMHGTVFPAFMVTEIYDHKWRESGKHNVSAVKRSCNVSSLGLDKCVATNQRNKL